jgi:hypothetical protein
MQGKYLLIQLNNTMGEPIGQFVAENTDEYIKLLQEIPVAQYIIVVSPILSVNSYLQGNQKTQGFDDFFNNTDKNNDFLGLN